MVTVGLPPNRLRLWFYAVDRVKNHYAAIQHAQTALHLGGKIDVAGRIDDVDLRFRAGQRVAPTGCDRRRLDRDATFAFLRPPVRHGGAFIHFAQGMRVPRIKEHPLGRGRLPSVDMGNHANVANLGEFCGHSLSLLLRS